MLKNIITRINNFIQWTKKWHVCHIYINIFLPIFIYSLFFVLRDKNILQELLENITCSALILYIMAYYALLIILLISIISHITQKKLHIISHFLLHNQFYNNYYSFGLIIIIFCLCYPLFTNFLYCLIFLIFYFFAFLVFLALKKIFFLTIDIIIKMLKHIKD